MRKKFIFLLGVCSAAYLQAQYQGRVGINTDKPEADLHVAGTFKATELLLDQNPYAGNPDEIPKLGQTESYSFLLKSKNMKRITTYNTQSGSATNAFPAPFGVITFKITVSATEDYVQAFDTKINSNKYIAIINSFNYNNVVKGGSSSANERMKAPVAQVYTYKQDNKWWIKADYHGFAHKTDNTTVGEWEINLMVFDKDFAREFNHEVVFTDNNTNPKQNVAAASPLIPN